MSAKKSQRVKKSLPGVSRKRVREELVKSETVQLRVSPRDKAEMKKAANFCRLSVSEYLIRCHRIAWDRLSESRLK